MLIRAQRLNSSKSQHRQPFPALLPGVGTAGEGHFPVCQGKSNEHLAWSRQPWPWGEHCTLLFMAMPGHPFPGMLQPEKAWPRALQSVLTLQPHYSLQSGTLHQRGCIIRAKPGKHKKRRQRLFLAEAACPCCYGSLSFRKMNCPPLGEEDCKFSTLALPCVTRTLTLG